MSPLASVRQAPTTMRRIPLRPVEKAPDAPRDRSFPRQGRVIFAGGVEHDFDDALDIAVNGRQSANVQSHASSEGRSHLGGIQLFAFNLTGLDNILGQRLQRGLFGNWKPRASMRPSRRPCK